MHHAVHHTPYEGKELSAWPALTMLRGEVVWDGGRFLVQAGHGQFLRCTLPETARPRMRDASWRKWVGLDG